MNDTNLVLGGKEFSSRLIVGTGKYSSMEIMKEAHEASGAEIITVALRRVSLPSGDRKSTRLNSSHLVISYAVFCLKKKKNILYLSMLLLYHLLITIRYTLPLNFKHFNSYLLFFIVYARNVPETNSTYICLRSTILVETI